METSKITKELVELLKAGNVSPEDIDKIWAKSLADAKAKIAEDEAKQKEEERKKMETEKKKADVKRAEVELVAALKKYINLKYTPKEIAALEKYQIYSSIPTYIDTIKEFISGRDFFKFVL